MLKVCAGSIYGFCKSFARITREERNKKGNELLNQETVCTDTTIVTMNAKQGYIRNFSGNNAALYAAMEKKAGLHLMRYLSWILYWKAGTWPWNSIIPLWDRTRGTQCPSIKIPRKKAKKRVIAKKQNRLLASLQYIKSAICYYFQEEYNLMMI